MERNESEHFSTVNKIWPFGFDQSLSFPTADQGDDDAGNEFDLPLEKE